MNQEQEDQIIVCSINDCGKKYSNKYSNERHLRKCHSDETLRCDHLGCDYVTGNKFHLKQHLVIHSNDRPFTCNIDDCGKTFKRKVGLRSHQICHSSGQFQCTREGCEQIFKTEIYLKQHINDKHSSMSFVCRDCGKEFDTIGKRGYHQRVAHQMVEQPIVCQIDDCGQEFNSRYFYKLHLERRHFKETLRCDRSGCDYVTTYNWNLRRHLTSHPDNRLFICDINGCDKTFKFSHHLKNHMKTHSKSRSPKGFACNAYGCWKIYRTEEYFNRHMGLVHSILYKCKSDGCLAAFRSYCQYKVHLRQCHNRGSLSCAHPDCDYTTDHKGHLSVHVKKHSEEHPFVCDTDGCGKAFKYVHNLKAHQRKRCYHN